MPHAADDQTRNTGDTWTSRFSSTRSTWDRSCRASRPGKPYQIVNQFGTFDWSTVVYPGGHPRRCETCHEQTTGAAQATAYLTHPTRAACGSCHDDVNFATGVNHAGGPQIDDNQCANCHIPQGEIDFDASIKGAHVVPTASSMLSGLVVSLA